MNTAFLLFALHLPERRMFNEQDVQEKRLNAMKYKILKAEQENLKTREKTTDQMVETIRRIIMDEAKKNY